MEQERLFAGELMARAASEPTARLTDAGRRLQGEGEGGHHPTPNYITDARCLNHDRPGSDPEAGTAKQYYNLFKLEQLMDLSFR